MKKLLVATGILLLSVAPAMASNFYGKGTLGFFSPDESGLDKSFALYVAGGMNLKDQLNVPISAEVGIGYTEPSESFIDVTIIPLTMTVLYELPLPVPHFAFNVGGGLGLYYWNIEEDYWFGHYEDDGIEPGIHLQTGADFKLNDRINLVGELKYSVTSDADGADIGGISANVGAKLNF